MPEVNNFSSNEPVDIDIQASNFNSKSKWLSKIIRTTLDTISTLPTGGPSYYDIVDLQISSTLKSDFGHSWELIGYLFRFKPVAVRGIIPAVNQSWCIFGPLNLEF